MAKVHLHEARTYQQLLNVPRLLQMKEDKKTGERKVSTIKHIKQKKCSSVLLLLLHCCHDSLQCPCSARTTAENEM